MVQELLKELKINGQIVVADALNCQKYTAKLIIDSWKKGEQAVTIGTSTSEDEKATAILKELKY